MDLPIRYWLTTHWPPREDSPNTVAGGVWLADGKEDVGARLGKGDLVLVYQSRTGRSEIRRDIRGTEYRVRCLPGREGIVAIGETTSPFVEDPDNKPERYVDGSEIWWKWYSPLKVLSRSGYVPRAGVNTVLGYKTTYNFRGFGDAHSGLMQLSKEQFTLLAGAFTNGRPVVLPALPLLPRFRNGPGGSGIESLDHLTLKEFVASNPSLALGEEGLSTVKLEYWFPTGDRADIVLSDRLGRILGVEIELGVGDADWEGPLQAIKYRYMLEPLTKRSAGDSRSILIAYDISVGIKKTCAAYGVECFEVDRAAVGAWTEAKSETASQLNPSLDERRVSNQLL